MPLGTAINPYLIEFLLGLGGRMLAIVAAVVAVAWLLAWTLRPDSAVSRALLAWTENRRLRQWWHRTPSSWALSAPPTELDGVAMLFDFGNTLSHPPSPMSPALQDRYALANDWAVIGADLYGAIGAEWFIDAALPKNGFPRRWASVNAFELAGEALASSAGFQAPAPTAPSTSPLPQPTD